MRIFEPHIHMFSRVTDDYERMAMAGIAGVLEPAFWLGQPRTSVGSFIDYFDALIGWERFRASQFGIRHVCTMALNPREANEDRVNDAVMEVLPRYLDKDGVVGVGEIGFDDMTAREEKYFRLQAAMARERGLPILVHTPHRDKKLGTERSIAVARDAGLPDDLVLIDHNNEETIPIVRATGCWAGFSIYPNTKMTPERMVEIFRRFGTERILVNSAADWGVSDPLLVPKTVLAMRRAGMAEEEISTVVWENPLRFFGQSGRLAPTDFDATPAADPAARFQGSTIRRGQPA